MKIGQIEIPQLGRFQVSHQHDEVVAKEHHVSTLARRVRP